MSTESEAMLESKLIDELSNNGYEKIEIKNEEDLKKNFKKQIEKLNDIKLTEDEFKKLLIYLDKGSIFDKAKKLRERYPIKREKKTKHIIFLNQDKWCKNIFQVSNQIRIENKYKNRYDVTILINGLPLVQIELKKRGVELKEAFNQIGRYKQHSYKGLFNYIQIFVISNGVNTKYFSNGNRSDMKFEFTYFWKDKDNKNIKKLDEFTKTFLEKCNLAKMISQYMVLNHSSKKLMILRAYQKYAVEAVINQAINIKQNGYVWHTTGSGKTLTSFKVSQLLEKEQSIDKVIFVVDRRDLDTQTTKEFNNFTPDFINPTDNTNILVKELTSDNKLIITTIQKLDNAVKKDAEKLQKVKDKRIIFIYDECHRSQFGKMHQNIHDFFTNSLSYGFTGTPIFKDNAMGNKTTKSIFGKKLHQYLIKDAIADNNVLGFSVDYYGGAELNNSSDQEVKSIDTEEYLESSERLDQITDFIIKSYPKKTRNKKFNAMLTVSRGSIIHKYYKLLKEKDPNLKIAVIYTWDANEEIQEKHSRDYLEEYIQDYNKMFKTNYSTDTFREYQNDISKRMKNRDIDLLIVKDMFLTGFDSPILNTLYVDKKFEYHTLLQAYSRTNRIYDKTKSQGNIVCFRPLEDETKDAIKLFSNKSPLEDILLREYEYYVKEFNNKLKELHEVVKTVEDAQNIESEDKKKNFVLKFRNMVRTKNKLDIFTEFTFDDLKIEEQEYNDFKSVYLDIYDEQKEDGENISVLNDIDFELVLLRNDKINVDYILKLMEDLDPEDKSYQHDKENILKKVRETEQLRSKIDLIQRFIDEKLGRMDKTKTTVEEEFDEFMRKERKKELYDLITDERLDEEITREVISDYEFSERFDDTLIKESFIEELKFKERREKKNKIKDRIKKILERFTY